MKLTVAELISVLFLVGGFGIGIGTTLIKVDSVQQDVNVMKQRQYVLMGAMVKAGWILPQDMLGKAIGEGWQPAPDVRYPDD